MRKKLLIGLALYLAVGVLFGLLTQRASYMCPGTDEWSDIEPTAIAPEDFALAEDAPMCDPDAFIGRLPWFGIATAGWLPLVIRDIVRGNGVPTGSITLRG